MKPLQSCPALLVAAPASGQGKTTLVAALARHHWRQGRRVRVFKTGPDFLDPMILSRAAQAPVEPLDLWMVGVENCQRKLYAAATVADVILIEGAMGLFDGTPSSADLAQAFALPIAVLLDAKGMGQTFGALAHGLVNYRSGLRFTGVIANRVASVRHAELLTAGLDRTLPFLGALRPLPQAVLPSRHLGLVQAQEIADLDARLDAAADWIAALPLAQLPPTIAFTAPPLAPTGSRRLVGCRIAVAKDAAFSFIYLDNLVLLRALGATIVEFSPLTATNLEADAVYLPGGYPELHLATLAANTAMHAALRRHLMAGRPIYAECGGMLYLLEHLTNAQGMQKSLVGLLPGSATMQSRLAGLGMQTLELPAGRLRGHSFHYSTMTTPLTPITVAIRPNDTRPGEAFYQHGALRASYLHLYFPSAPEAAAALFLPQ